MKKLIFSVLAVAAMASCSKSELVERPVVDGDVAIKLTSEVLTVKQAIKAPFEGYHGYRFARCTRHRFDDFG